MVSKIESGHGLLFLSKIIVPEESSNTPKPKIAALAQSFTTWGFNFSAPLVCLTDEEEKYHLLTGLPIYEAAKDAGLKQIWVLLIALKQPEAEKLLENFKLQLNLNEQLIKTEDLEEFRDFLNNNKSSLTSISGIKSGYEKLIKDKRPFNSADEMFKALGAKRCLNWFKAYKSYLLSKSGA